MITGRNLKRILVLSLFLFLFFTGMFMWRDNLFNFTQTINASKFGEFGSFIGGIFGTVFAGLGFILLIYTYLIQQNENQINRQTQDIGYINNLYANILEDVNSLTFKEYKGIDVFYNFNLDNYNNLNSVMDHLNSILFSFENLILIAKTQSIKMQILKILL